jgi:hypothetical protein
MELSTFPTFLAFPTQALCSAAPANNPWRGLDIPSYLRREPLGLPTVEAEANDVTGRTCSISALRHKVHGRPWLARWGHNKPVAWAEGRSKATGTISVSDMMASAGKKAQGS